MTGRGEEASGVALPAVPFVFLRVRIFAGVSRGGVLVIDTTMVAREVGTLSFVFFVCFVWSVWILS